MPRLIDASELPGLVGQEIATGDWFEVTQDRIDRFAGVTEDRQWIHTEPDRALVESPYGAAIAHGFLTLSLLSYLSREAVEVTGSYRRRINYGLNRVRFPAAVPAGAKVRARFLLSGFREVDGGVEVTWGVTVEVEGSDKPACVAEWVTRLYR